MSEKADIWMPLYIGDYLAATQHLTTEESGAYLHLLMHAWKEGPLPVNEELLRRITRMDRKRWTATWALLSPFFQRTESGFVQKRLETERVAPGEQKDRRSQHGRAGANARWGKPSSEEGQALPEQCPGITGAMPGYGRHLHLYLYLYLKTRTKTRRLRLPSSSMRPQRSDLQKSDSSKLITDEYVVEGVFEHYLQRMGRNAKLYALTSKRLRAGVRAYKECKKRFPGGTRAELAMVTAVDGLALNKFNMGENPERKRYTDWIAHLFKDVETMEKRWEDAGGCNV